jgi:hypothetical protein
MIVGDALDALFESGRSEVDEKTQGKLEQTQVGRGLFGMHWR